jgi:CRP/FNR family transcriptional regulator
MKTHDPLSYLPRARVLDLPKRCVIYDSARPPVYLYLVLMGRVSVFCSAIDGTQTLLRIVTSEGFFGEGSLVPRDLSLKESAIATERTQVMCWSTEDIERQIEREPRLGLALLEGFGANNLLLRDRVAALALYKTGPRVTLALVQLAKTIGELTPAGALRINGLTHQSIADYVGTSREIVTSEMNHLRRLGYVEYSRRYIDVFADGLSEWLRQQGTSIIGLAVPSAAATSAGAVMSS